MGNTCASVHIALTAAKPDPVNGIIRAYSTIGFEQTKTQADDGKHVILLRQEGDAFLSVYDSDNADLDTGELKALALAASKIFKSAAVCTGLFDSDTFEFVVFNAGKQVDLVMNDPEQVQRPSQDADRRGPREAMEQDVRHTAQCRTDHTGGDERVGLCR